MPRLAMAGASAARAFGFLRTAISNAVDEYFNRVTLLLNTSSTNGAQNNTFLDSSTNNFTITRNGNTTQGTFTPFSQTGWSNYFSATGDNIRTGTMTALGSDFTLECWVYPTSFANYNVIWDNRTADGSTTGFAYGLDANGKAYFYTSSAFQITTTTALVANRWTHLALVRSGSGSGNCKIYINGVADATTGTYTTSFSNTAAYIGNDWDGTGAPFAGYISNLRATTGVLYTGTFTPSTTLLTTTVSAGTCVLLTCQSNRFIDNSASAVTITPNATPSVQAFSPFAPTAAYDPAVVGGSMFNSATPDGLKFLTSTTQFAVGGDFTIEMWFYPTAALSGYNPLWGLYDSSGSDNPSALLFYNSSYNLFWLNNGAGGNGFDAGAGINIVPFQWNHIAISRSGADIRCWTNGVLRISNWGSGTLDANKRILYVATNRPGTDVAPGYISGFRFVNGTAVYSGASNFTPPTAPPTAITNTVALVNCTNAGIYDSASKNVLETVGNAQVSTTQAKWGTTSMYFDGTGDYLVAPSNQLYNFRTGDFTIECWVRLITVNTAKMIVSTNYDSSTGGGGWAFVHRADISSLMFTCNANVTYTKSWSPSANTWYHIAVCRSGTSLRLFVDGTQIGTTSTSTDNITGASTLVVAGNLGGGANLTLDAYMDDLRITNYARYTANFTPPTAAFPLQ